jgi:hypothetical protein
MIEIRIFFFLAGYPNECYGHIGQRAPDHSGIA